MDTYTPVINPYNPLNSNNLRFDDKPAHVTSGIHNIIIQISILAFGALLVWFAFVYYPKVIDKYKNVPLPTSQSSGKVLANFSGFPIETVQFRITYEAKPNSYYVFVEGDSLPTFVDNKNRAILALKSVLSVESVCKVNIFYVSVQRLEIPDNLKISPNCQ